MSYIGTHLVIWLMHHHVYLSQQLQSWAFPV